MLRLARLFTLTILCVSGLLFAAEATKPVQLHVFIHGTVGTSLHIVNFTQVLKDTLTDTSKAVKLLKKFRQHPLLKQDQPLLDEGFIEIPYQKIVDCHAGNLLAEEANHACYHILAAYDAIAESINFFERKEKNYALFGWSGLLSHTKRLEAAVQLYTALADFADACEKETGIYPEIYIHAHSHGGTVGCLLVYAEQAQKRGLKIKLLHMLGTPIHKELIPAVESPMFETIICGYSEGDKVQANDKLSNQEHHSYRKMADLSNTKQFVKNNPTCRRCDIEYLADHDKKRIDHSNLWHLGRSTKIFDALDPLPFVVVTPSIIQLVEKCPEHTHYRAQVVSSTKALVAHLSACKNGKRVIVGKSPNIFETVINCREKTVQCWHPLDSSRHVFFNLKNFIAFKSIFKR